MLQKYLFAQHANKYLQLVSTLLSFIKTCEKLFSNFVAFSKCFNFI